MWLDYKGQRHFLPTGMPEEPFISPKSFCWSHMNSVGDVGSLRYKMEIAYAIFILQIAAKNNSAI